MFIWLSGLVVFLIFFILFWVRYGLEGEMVICSFLLGIVGCCVAFLVSLAACCFVPESAIGVVDQTETELIAIKDDNHCDTYLCRNYIDEELKYTYLYKVPGKGITSNRINADRAYIKYIEEGEAPKVITTKIAITNPIFNFICVVSKESLEKEEYLFYIPKNAIIVNNTYEIDLE